MSVYCVAVEHFNYVHVCRQTNVYNVSEYMPHGPHTADTILLWLVCHHHCTTVVYYSTPTQLQLLKCSFQKDIKYILLCVVKVIVDCSIED